MSNGRLSTAFLTAVVAYMTRYGTLMSAPGSQEPTPKSYSLPQVLEKLSKREGRPFYVFVPGDRPSDDMLARVVYLPVDQRMFIDAIPAGMAPNGRTAHELLAEEPVVKSRLTAPFDAQLMIQNCGRDFGSDERCDLYSVLKAKPLFGKQIGTDAKRAFAHYVQAIGEALNRK